LCGASQEACRGAARSAPACRARPDRAAQAAAAFAAAPGPVPVFMAEVVHELRVPAANLVGMASALLASVLDDRQRRCARIAHDTAGHLLALVDGLLDLARLEHGEIRLDPQPTDIDLWLAGTLDPFAEVAARKGLYLHGMIGPEVPRHLCLDGLRLRQVLWNLIDNAIRFTRRGEVSLRLARLPGVPRVGLRCEVRDTGCGLTTQERRRLSGELRQVQPAPAGLHGGTGIGLALCRRLIERMGGRIGTQSLRGRRSLFWLELELGAGPAGASVPG
ncbi:MAG: hypothetical protein KGM91_22965, partial [Burkholderiales bacterium]|nr:hypothetical protein [Burkholderiales bacterium]